MSDFLQRLTTALSDRYRIERELGSGGMATVYLAHDLKHDRQVRGIGHACLARMEPICRIFLTNIDA